MEKVRKNARRPAQFVLLGDCAQPRAAVSRADMDDLRWSGMSLRWSFSRRAGYLVGQGEGCW